MCVFLAEWRGTIDLCHLIILPDADCVILRFIFMLCVDIHTWLSEQVMIWQNCFCNSHFCTGFCYYDIFITAWFVPTYKCVMIKPFFYLYSGWLLNPMSWSKDGENLDWSRSMQIWILLKNGSLSAWTKTSRSVGPYACFVVCVGDII